MNTTVGKAYVADSVHELFSELQIAQAENQKLKQELTGVNGENKILREQLTDLRAMYETKSADCAAFYTILEQTAANIGLGIKRVSRQRTGREMVQQERQEPAAAEQEVHDREPLVPREVQTYAPPSQRPQRVPLAEEARNPGRPQFLKPVLPIAPDHPGLPEVRMTPRDTEQVLGEMEQILSGHREEQ